MATLRLRLHKKNGSDGYDIIHLETSASMVLMASGTSVEDKIAAMDTTIANKAESSHGTHVTWSTTAPKVAGTAAVGSETNCARGDHVHAAQTTITGNAGSATKLATARNFRTNLASTSTASFNGTAACNPGVTGTLGVGNGGTGVTTLLDLAVALGAASDGRFFIASSSAPSNTKILWIDTANSNILKFHNGSSWVAIHTTWA